MPDYAKTAYISQAGETVVVRQEWVPGEKWWRSYERTVAGKPHLKAERLNAGPLPSRHKTKPAPLPKHDFSLRLDPRLQKTVQIEREPKLGELLDILRDATKLELTLADNLKDHDPHFGVVLAAKGMLAWQVMELIREKQLKDGRWPRTAKGYQLTGTSLATPPPKEEAKSGAFWWWAAGGVVVGGVGLVCWRRRKRANGTLPSNGG